MNAIYLYGFRRRIEQRIKLLIKLSGQIVVATEQTLQHVFNNEGSLIPAPIRMVVDRRQLDQCQSRD